MILALGAAAIVPGLFLMWFFHAMDVHKEPPRVLWASFGLGVLTIPFVLLLVWPIDPLLELARNPYARGTLDAFFEAAIPEELLKYAVLLGYAYRHREFDEPMDGIVYGAAASLGFATLENVLYVGSGGLGVAVLRAVTAVPGHACSGVIMGYFVGRAKFEPERRAKLLAAGLFFPILLHGLYDTPLLIFKAFDELGVSQSGHEGYTAALLFAWLAAFLFEVIWALRLAIRLRQTQLTAMVQTPPGHLRPPVHAPQHPGVQQPSGRGPRATTKPQRQGSPLLKGWLQIGLGVLLGGIGGVLTLGFSLVLVAGEVSTGDMRGFFVALTILGLVPCGLGALCFWLGLRNLHRRTSINQGIPATYG